MSGLRRRGRRDPRGSADADPLFLAAADLRVRQTPGVARLLLRRDPREDAVEMLVFDEGPGIEVRVVPVAWITLGS